MSTTYYVACARCVAKTEHIHKSEDWEDDPDGRGIAHSSGWWRMSPERLDQSLTLVNEYGEVMDVAEARRRTGR